MKAKVVIENHEITIVLTPENSFEIDVIEKVYTKKDLHIIHTQFDLRENYGSYSNHRIELSVKETF